MKTPAFALATILITLAGCESKEGAVPTGQVVATVDGKEITLMDLHQEAGTTQPDKALEQAALRSLVIRNLLADAAIDDELDQLPATAVMKDKAQQMVLVDALTNKIRASVPAPSAEEARQYAADHPASFDQRRIFLVDQLIILANTPALIKAIEPLDTLEQIEQLLVQRKVGFRRSVGTIDALSINADAAEKIAQLPADAVFASPEGNVIRANTIRETIIEPVTGKEAEKLALEMIRRQRTDAFVANKVQEILAEGQKSVQYNPAYQLKDVGTNRTASSQ